MRFSKTPRPLFAFVVGLACILTPFRAQTQQESSRPKLLIINSLIGGSTAAITAAIHHRPVRRAMATGLAGGAMVFVGKCVLGNARPVTDWIGHQTVAIGSSVVANASTGRGALERVVVPLGPIRIYHDTKRHRTNIKLDLLQTGVAMYYASQPATSVDWKLSAKHDALIVLDKKAPSNFEVAGVIKTWSKSPSLLDHEQIHVAQEQFVTTAMEEPLEGFLLPRVPAGKWTHRYFEIGMLAPAWAAANAIVPRFDRPWEQEAEAVKGRC